jgi:hypothetical protein
MYGEEDSILNQKNIDDLERSLVCKQQAKDKEEEDIRLQQKFGLPPDCNRIIL